jgi:esterase/lipase superfamily enzyme
VVAKKNTLSSRYTTTHFFQDVAELDPKLIHIAPQAFLPTFFFSYFLQGLPTLYLFFSTPDASSMQPEAILLRNTTLE